MFDKTGHKCEHNIKMDLTKLQPSENLFTAIAWVKAGSSSIALTTFKKKKIKHILLLPE
jgi:hypothetical protein